MAEPRPARACGTARSRSIPRRSRSPLTWMMKVSGPPTSEQAPSQPRLHVPPPWLPGIPAGWVGVCEVVPSLHHSPSLRCRIRLDPHPAALLCREQGPWLPLPRLGPSGSTSWKVLPGTAGVHCAGQEMLGTCMRGHLLQLHNFPPKPGLEEVAGGLGGVRGSVAFLVFEKCFSPLRCCSDSPGQSGRHQPAAAHTGDPLQLPLTMTYSRCPHKGLSAIRWLLIMSIYTCGSC